MCDNAFLPYFPALLTAIIAGAAAWLTNLQHKTNDLRLKHELFELRFQVYEAFRSFLGGIMHEGKTSHAACLTMLRETNQAEFLFGPDVPKYLLSAYHKGLDLVESHRKLDGIPRLPVGDERSRVAHENAEQLKWFADQYNVLPERFGKYLNLTRLE
jgi:hypothetical protein